MSGSTIGGAVGAAIGYMIGGPGGAKLGWTVGSMVGAYVMPDVIGIQDQVGPRLHNLKLTYSTYGSPMNRVYGAYRVGGTIIWADDIKEVKHVREVEVGKGSETYDVIWYTYSIDAAIAICEGPIAEIHKIWADSVLLYDDTLGGYTQSFLDTDEVSGKITIYNGTNSQEVDWYLESFEEDSPAYRNVSYIVLNTFQLEMFGNRIPNFTFEVSTKSTDASYIEIYRYNIPLDQIASPIKAYQACGLRTNPDNGTLRAYAPQQNGDLKTYEMKGFNDPWLTKTETPSYGNSTGNVRVDYGGWLTRDGYYTITIRDQNGKYKFIGPGADQIAISYVDIVNDRCFAYCGNNATVNTRNRVIELIEYTGGATPSTKYKSILYSGSTSPIYQNMHISESGELFSLRKDVQQVDVFDLNGRLKRSMPHDWDIADYELGQGNEQCFLYTKNDNTEDVYAIKERGNGTITAYKISEQGNEEWLLHGTSHVDLSYEMATIYRDNFYLMNSSYNTVNGVKVMPIKVYSRVASPISVSLESILLDLCIKSGISSVECDFSGARNIYIKGFVLANIMSARAAISTLQNVYLFDMIEEDFKLKLKFRGEQLPVKTINEIDTNDLEVVKKLETELPKKITVMYADRDINYQNASQSVMRMDGNSHHNISIELPIVLNSDEAKQIADKLLTASWSSNKSITFNIPVDTSLKVSDILNIQYENILYSIRIVGILYSKENLMSIEGVTEDSAVYVSNAEGSATNYGFQENASNIQGPTALKVFNAPTLYNTEINSQGIYYTANGYIDTWKGCEVFKSYSQTLPYSSVGAILPDEATAFGDVIGSISPITTSYTVWDLETEIEVSIYSGELYSSDYAAVLNGSNRVKIGDEILQYVYATETNNGTYILSKLLRGRQGTEWAINTHSTNEDFIFINEYIQFNFSTLNAERYYKGVTIGTYIQDAIEVSEIYDGTNLKPFSPSYVYIDVNTVYWTRRDRYLKGRFKLIELSESEEKYRLEFLLSGVVQSTVYVSDTTEYTFTPGGFDSISISQYSGALLDYGYPTEVDI